MKKWLYVVLAAALTLTAWKGNGRELTATRGELVLNGVWSFAPGIGNEPPKNRADWGEIRVPGSYVTRGAWQLPGVTKRGDSWKSLKLETLSRGWYRQTFQVPERWNGRAILLQLDRVSTDALIQIDGKKSGTIHWPGGALDITDHAVPGKIICLDILTVSVPEETEVMKFMDHNVAHAEPKDLSARGLIGDVVLESRPRGLHVGGVFIKTGMRNGKSIRIETELEEFVPGEKITLTAVIRDRKRNIAKSISKDFIAASVLTLEAAWPEAKLWELDDPVLYSLELELRRSGRLLDVYAERFGFREFRMEGRNFLLNNLPIRLRPALASFEKYVGGVAFAVKNHLTGLKQANFNIVQLWPRDLDQRGEPDFQKLWAVAADELGMPLIYPALCMNRHASNWKKSRPEWEKKMVRDWKRIRNHPSIVMLFTSPNQFSFGDDQNPRRIGQRKLLVPNEAYNRRVQCAREAIAIIKAHDDTRIINTHHGGAIGDYHTSNIYLNMIPLQEREDWLSVWAEHGDSAISAIEFGTPFSFGLLRSRNGYQARTSETQFTEHAAAYFGLDAYREEPLELRRELRDHFLGGWKYRDMLGSMVALSMNSHTRLQTLFVRNTFRSWRAWGITGGMIPWELAYGWNHTNKGEDAPPFQPGTRGTWRPRLGGYQLYGLMERGFIPNETGRELMRVNAPRYAYLAGAPGAFTSKDHHFYGGETLCKQAVLFNDARTQAEYTFDAVLRINGRQDEVRHGSGLMRTGTTEFQKLEFSLPEVSVITPAELLLEYRIGETKGNDRLEFTVFPRLAAPDADDLKKIRIFDPAGNSRKMLEAIGWKTERYSSGRPDCKLLIIGAKALSRKVIDVKNLEAFVASGGRLLILEQSTNYLLNNAGFRILRQSARRVFPVETMTSHPVIQGVDAEMLRDWRGSGDAQKAEIGTEISTAKTPVLTGYHWGNRGAVAGTAIEKIQHAGWRPILHCGYDLAYSPLMELSYGRGKILWSTLELSHRSESDPAAEMLADRMMRYLLTALPEPRAVTVVLGDKAFHSELETFGLKFSEEKTLPKTPGLAVVSGSEAGKRTEELEEFMKRGGNVVLIAENTENLPFGFQTRKNPDAGSFAVLPERLETRGISGTELRLRGAQNLSEFIGEAHHFLGFRTYGSGSLAVWILPPWKIDSTKLTYQRWSIWHLRRALAQILANSGAGFTADRRGWTAGRKQAAASRLSLDGRWLMKTETLLESAPIPQKRHDDPPLRGVAAGYVSPECDTSDWKEISLPGNLALFEQNDGTVFVRRELEIPPEWAGRNLILHLGVIDDCDITWFDGVEVGRTTLKTPEYWKKQRRYAIPGHLATPGRHTLVIRVLDAFGSGGFAATEGEMCLEAPGVVDFYAPGFRLDFEYGDEPYRYQRW